MLFLNLEGAEDRDEKNDSEGDIKHGFFDKNVTQPIRCQVFRLVL